MVQAPSELALSLDDTLVRRLMQDFELGITVGCRRPAIFLSDWLHLPLEPHRGS